MKKKRNKISGFCSYAPVLTSQRRGAFFMPESVRNTLGINAFFVVWQDVFYQLLEGMKKALKCSVFKALRWFQRDSEIAREIVKPSLCKG